MELKNIIFLYSLFPIPFTILQSNYECNRKNSLNNFLSEIAFAMDWTNWLPTTTTLKLIDIAFTQLCFLRHPFRILYNLYNSTLLESKVD